MQEDILTVGLSVLVHRYHIDQNTIRNTHTVCHSWSASPWFESFEDCFGVDHIPMVPDWFITLRF